MYITFNVCKIYFGTRSQVNKAIDTLVFCRNTWLRIQLPWGQIQRSDSEPIFPNAVGPILRNLLARLGCWEENQSINRESECYKTKFGIWEIDGTYKYIRTYSGYKILRGHRKRNQIWRQFPRNPGKHRLQYIKLDNVCLISLLSLKIGLMRIIYIYL